MISQQDLLLKRRPIHNVIYSSGVTCLDEQTPDSCARRVQIAMLRWCAGWNGLRDHEQGKERQ
jgi:hypothetical protein